nr:Hypothetical protein [Klebsiella pneumoniae]
MNAVAVAAVRYVKSDKKAGGVAVIFCVAQAKKKPFIFMKGLSINRWWLS